MARRTTADWEALLQGIEDGRWEFQRWGDQNQNGDYSESILFDEHGETLAYGLPDSAGELASAAPEAVTELVYMHGALNSLVTWCETKAMKARNYPQPGAQKQMERTAIVYEELARRVTEILETDLTEEDDYDVHGDVDE